nr:MAG TPA: hypothetical protein [Bacteriophage sp.]
MYYTNPYFLKNDFIGKRENDGGGVLCTHPAFPLPSLPNSPINKHFITTNLVRLLSPTHYS